MKSENSPGQKAPAKGVLRSLTRGRLLGKILWNVFGIATPLLIAAIVVPRLLASIGVERFGFLALAWGLIGYATAMDLGIGRATTQQVARMRNGADAHQIPNLFATARRLTTLTSTIGMCLIAIAAMAGVYRYIRTEAVPLAEIQYSMLLLALALPMQAVSATYRGVNEAYLNFRSISILRILLGAANFGGPYLVALWTQELHWLVSTLVVSRALALMLYRKFAHDCLSQDGHADRGRYAKAHAHRLLQFGGWYTISSIVSPLLVQADRFFVGALISAAAVTVYVLPYEVTVQTLVFVSAVSTVSFPLISSLLTSSPSDALRVFHSWLLRVSCLMLVVLATLAYVMPDLLRLWIGESVAPESILVGRILCVGVFFNSIGVMYFAWLHAQGKTLHTAVLHMIELPFFIGSLYFLINRYGVSGAAIAWTLRVTVDALALVAIARGANKSVAWQPVMAATPVKEF